MHERESLAPRHAWFPIEKLPQSGDVGVPAFRIVPVEGVVDGVMQPARPASPPGHDNSRHVPLRELDRSVRREVGPIARRKSGHGKSAYGARARASRPVGRHVVLCDRRYGLVKYVDARLDQGLTFNCVLSPTMVRYEPAHARGRLVREAMRTRIEVSRMTTTPFIAATLGANIVSWNA